MDPNWENLASPVKILLWAICLALSLVLLAGAAYLFRAGTGL